MKDLKEMINEAIMLNPSLKKYKNNIEKFLSDYEWEKVKPMDVVAEFEYGDEYYMLVNDIMNHLEIDDDKLEKYRFQIETYSNIAEKSFGRKVTKKAICLVDLQKIIEF